MLGLCSFVANFSQAFMRPLVWRYVPKGGHAQTVKSKY